MPIASKTAESAACSIEYSPDVQIVKANDCFKSTRSSANAYIFNPTPMPMDGKTLFLFTLSSILVSC